MKKTFLLCLIVLISTATTRAQTAEQLSIVNGGKVWALLYQQRAAEYKALCFQAYNIARLRLDEALKQKSKKPLAIITDIDETVLDNSPYDAARAVKNKDFDLAGWKAWTAKGIADTVPGAPSFFKYAASKGVTVFYVTNRDEDEREGTTKNLKLYKLPNADKDHIVLKQSISSKEARRQEILKKYNVVLYCGDNLPDFDSAYDNKPLQDSRNAATERLKKYFGYKYIVIPNPGYGDFENALFGGQKLNTAQKDSVLRALIKTSE
ncbi:5'-nucleotidase, lipoprotein e(P4) family [Mucilaginibacter auburnensis]|uniref:5'-nucleotidase (Lipoprotein e(P4) family) n=1 Tax=Mucilaginibacter auburnensis TaxID=1457233 RepID=A0A2H9VNE3_9SPHI|nr:5'-nucleotidase, lipoprotein e(P4) family [Mucilaginibacter auburnensis]PJJ79849.1 5'-nucleotidase (lipoprotein e(P4) family) [Mucilaginibacter auburnensis]